MGQPYTSALVHLSDLEFGANFRAPRSEYKRGHIRCAETLAEDLKTILIDGLKFTEKDIGIVITGDVASRGVAGEYEDAKAAIERLMDVLDIPRSQLAMVPGNHDVDWASCKTAFGELKHSNRNLSHKNETDRTKVRECPQKLAHFNRFFNDMCGRGCPNSESVAAFPDFTRLGIALIGFDTTWPCTFVKEDNYGQLPGEIYERGHEELQRLIAGEPRLIPMALMHHCPVPVDPPDGSYLRSSDTVLHEMWSAGFSVILCGHEHRAKSYELRPDAPQVFVSGSFGTNVDGLAQRYKTRAGHVEPNRYSVLLVAPEGASRLLVRKLQDPGGARALWESDPENSLDSIVLRRRQLAQRPEERLCTELALCVGHPQHLPDASWVVAACFEGPEDVLQSINSVTYLVEDQQLMAVNRDHHFLADFVLTSPNVHVNAVITTDRGQVTWPTAVPVPNP